MFLPVREATLASDWRAAVVVAVTAATSEAKSWILRAPRQGWEMSADSATKAPSFPFRREKRSFRFINSRLKRNYLPTDPNHQHKENRTKSSFFFQSLKDLKKKNERNVASLFSALLMSQSNIAKGIMEAHFQKLRKMKEFEQWSPDAPPMNLLPGWPQRSEPTYLLYVHEEITKDPTKKSDLCFSYPPYPPT